MGQFGVADRVSFPLPLTLFALIAYATDLNGLGSLLAAAEPVATLVFFLASAVTFAPFVVATAIGLLGFEKR